MTMAKIPKFKTDKEAARYWDTHSLTDFEKDLRPYDIVFVKPDRQVVSLRLDRKVVKSLKAYGAKKGLGCSNITKRRTTTQKVRDLAKHIRKRKEREPVSAKGFDLGR